MRHGTVYRLAFRELEISEGEEPVQMPCLMGSIGAMGPVWQERLDALEAATTLTGLVLAAMVLTGALAVEIVEEMLEARATAVTAWPPWPP